MTDHISEPQPSILSLDLWGKMERRIHHVLEEALLLLREETQLEISEEPITRQLRQCLITAHRRIHRENPNLALPSPPVIEANNQPSPIDKKKTEREDKIPDIQIAFFDDEELDDRKYAKTYTIECKRLGKPERKDRVFNENYVKHGIRRFLAAEYGYAQDTRSGAMIGYVQSMELQDIFTEINNATVKLSTPELPIPHLSSDVPSWNGGCLVRISTTLDRAIPISPFILYHFWLDVRDCYSNSKTAKTRSRPSGSAATVKNPSSRRKSKKNQDQNGV